ncbi:bifunctional AP-4-A phosphorylase/ADP sulfurylase [Dissophora globulifera]|nr:bifunctional AP-4-A phosphorylase/ADP sulfurylase [Dissophora globulifera]
MVAILNNFDTLLSTTYDSALASGDLIFTASETQKSSETEYDIQCEICYAPALAKKPQGVLPIVESDPNASKDRPSTPVIKKIEKSNPFLPHDPALYVADASNEHKVLLNKFCVVPKHFLVVTKAFKSQTEPLTPTDLLAVWSTLKALKYSEHAVAFYNCGSHSGASQPHKHMQVLPLAVPSPISMLVRECSKRQRGKKENRPGDVFSVPFDCINHVILLPSTDLVSESNQSQEDILTEAYITLMDAMMMSIREYAEQVALPERERELVFRTWSSSRAYNWLLTTEFMMIVPRKQESSNLHKNVSLNINSLGFAGMVLAKTFAELEVVKEKGVIALVSETGYPYEFDRESHARSVEEEQRR